MRRSSGKLKDMKKVYTITNCKCLIIFQKLNINLFVAFTDYYHQYDGFIYRRKSGMSVPNWVKDIFGMSITEVLGHDGEYALKQYLPVISDVMDKQDPDPQAIFNMFQDYSQVFRGGVKDHFLHSQNQYDTAQWQTVIR